MLNDFSAGKVCMQKLLNSIANPQKVETEPMITDDTGKGLTQWCVSEYIRQTMDKAEIVGATGYPLELELCGIGVRARRKNLKGSLTNCRMTTASSGNDKLPGVQ